MQVLAALHPAACVPQLGPRAKKRFVQEHGALAQRPSGDDGLYRSTVFPGLWLDPVALVSGDRRRLRAVVDLGCATPEHTAFVARLARARESATSR